MEGSSGRFTALEGGARVAAACAAKNTLAVEFGAFIATRLLYEQAHAIRGPLSRNRQRSVHIARATRVPVVAHEIATLTDLTVAQATQYDAIEDWSSELETKEVLVCTSCVLRLILEHQTLSMETINVLIIDSCHRVWQDDDLRYIMNIYKQSPENTRPRILALTYPIFNSIKKDETKSNKMNIDGSTEQPELMEKEGNMAVQENTERALVALNRSESPEPTELPPLKPPTLQPIDVYENYDDFDMYEKLEWKIEQLEDELCCQMDLAEDIDGGKRLSATIAKPKELLIEYRASYPPEQQAYDCKELERYMKEVVLEAIQFLDDHRYDPTEIYGEDLYEEFKNIPDPTIEPKFIFQQFLYILEQLGPYGADKAAFSLLTKLEKLKIKVPYERHFLLLCVCTSVFVKIRCFTDLVFSKYESDWDKIRLFSTPKVLRFAEILEQFQPAEQNDVKSEKTQSVDVTKCSVDEPKNESQDSKATESNNDMNKDTDATDSYSQDGKNVKLENDTIRGIIELEHETVDKTAKVDETADVVDISKEIDTEKDDSNVSNKMLEAIEKCDFTSLRDKIEDKVNIIESNLREITIEDYAKDKNSKEVTKDKEIQREEFRIVINENVNDSQNVTDSKDDKNNIETKSTNVLNECNNEKENEVCKPQTTDNKNIEMKGQMRRPGGRTRGRARAPRTHPRPPLPASADALCGVVFLRDALMAKIVFMLIVDMSRSNPRLWHLCAQYCCVERAADPATEALECQRQGRKQEDVLKKFRMHECNLLLATSALEEGIDLPRCNLVVRWDVPASYRSFGLCRARARAPRASHAQLATEEAAVSMCYNVAVYRELDQIITRKCGCGIQDEPPQSEEDHADNFTSLIKPYTPLDTGDHLDKAFHEKLSDEKKFHEISSDGKKFYKNTIDENKFHENTIDEKRFHEKSIVKKKFHEESSTEKRFREKIVDGKERYKNTIDKGPHDKASYGELLEKTDCESDKEMLFEKNTNQVLISKKGEVINEKTYNDFNCLSQSTIEKKIHENSCDKTIENCDNSKTIIPKSNLNDNNKININDSKSINESNQSNDKCNCKHSNIKSENSNVKSEHCDVKKNKTDDIGASVDLNSAIALINRYCGKLPSDTFTRLAPQWWMESVQLNGETAYICTLRLPLNCPVKYNIVGHPMPTRVLARRMVALQACRILHMSGELDHQLMPIGKENFKAADLETTGSAGEATDGPDSARPGTTKRRQYYFKRTAWTFTDCQPIVDTSDSEIGPPTASLKELESGPHDSTSEEASKEPNSNPNDPSNAKDSPKDLPKDMKTTKDPLKDIQSEQHDPTGATKELKSDLQKLTTDDNTEDLSKEIDLIKDPSENLQSNTNTDPSKGVQSNLLDAKTDVNNSSKGLSTENKAAKETQRKIQSEPNFTTADQSKGLQSNLHNPTAVVNNSSKDLPTGNLSIDVQKDLSKEIETTEGLLRDCRINPNNELSYNPKDAHKDVSKNIDAMEEVSKNSDHLSDAHTASEAKNTCEVPRIEKTGTKRNMLYAIVSKLWCALPERYNTRGRRLHAPQLATQALGILMARDQPDDLQIPAFPVYTRSGEVRVSVEYVPDADVRVSPRRGRLVRRFMRFVFSEVLRVRRRGMRLQSEGSSHNNYYIVPTIKTTREDGTSKTDIDWSFLELIYQHTEDKKLSEVERPNLWPEEEDTPRTQPQKEKEKPGKPKQMANPLLPAGATFSFDADKYREAVVTPWYRNQDQPQFFLVAEICWNLTPDSAFPSATHSSFRNYYSSKYGVVLTQSDQPLLDVDHTSARLNLLTPRYVNRKGVALPVSSERTRRAKRDRLDQKQILVPELCRVHPFAAPLWFATVALPCVLYRINALLIADEIRRAVAIDVGLGIPKIDETTCPGFQWPPLDFGWSLAEVLSADSEKEKKKDEEDTKAEEVATVEPPAPVDLEKEEEAPREKTINDILQEKECGDAGFEIGTWSNDMASSIPEPSEHSEFDDLMEPLPSNLTFCTSYMSGGAKWCDPIEKPKSQFQPTRNYDMADSDCSYMSSDFDTDDSDLETDDDEDTDASAFCSSKNSNAAMGVRIEYVTAHEAEAVDVERKRNGRPAPQPDDDDDEQDKKMMEKLLRDGEAPIEYKEKFRQAVAQHEQNIIEKCFITKDQPIMDFLPETKDSEMQNKHICAECGKMRDSYTESLKSGHKLDVSGNKIDLSDNKNDISGSKVHGTGRNYISGNNEDISYRRFIVTGNTVDITGNKLEISSIGLNSDAVISNHAIEGKGDVVDIGSNNKGNGNDRLTNHIESIRHEYNNTEISNLTKQRESNEIDCNEDDNKQKPFVTNELDTERLKIVTTETTAETGELKMEKCIEEIFPFGHDKIELKNGQICLESIEKNKRLLLNKLKSYMNDEDLKKLNCFSMIDVNIDSNGYVNEKVANVGFDKKENYEEKINKWRNASDFAPYYLDDKVHGKSFDFDYQPNLEGHPGPSPSVILQALTMSNANDGINLERLETIGDSFLKFAITAYLYCAHPTVHEGKLSHMRSKQVSNLNLYRLGRNKRLGARMIASKFEPHDNWLPPCHRPPPTLHPRHAEEPQAQGPSDSPEAPMDSSGCFIPYNLITQHSIPDKSIADCVEALIGAYLLECGPRGALLFMSWLGIRVLPRHVLPLGDDHPFVRAAKVARQKPQPPSSPKRISSTTDTESSCTSSDDEDWRHQQDKYTPEVDWSWKGRPVGSLRPHRDAQGRWVQPIFGELKAPPSPLLRYITDPEGELERMLSGYEALERTLQYRFRDRSLLLQALTHASHQQNRLTDCYQRLEFLGDAILDYLITRHLYEDPRRHSPGALTDLRSALVNNTIFATLAARHGFHKYFRHMSPGLNEVLTKYVKIQEENGHSISEEHYLIQEDEMEQAEDVEVPKALGDLFESVAGAIFLDSGMSLGAVWQSYVTLMGAELEAFSAAAPKSPVRELLEAEPDTAKFGKPERLADGRRVRVCVEVFGRGTFKGVGRNYRIAKGTAARCALRHLRGTKQR